MPRKARVVIPKVPHHITQRGNNRQDVFFVEKDKEVYLFYLKKYSEKYGLDVQGYCLMTNHIHLIATPQKKDSLAKAIGRTHYYYTLYINKLHGRDGHLWQNRFYSCALGEEAFWYALKYVERNPVRAKIVRKAWLYPWSSAGVHTGKKVDKIGLLDMGKWEKISEGLDWQEILMEKEKDEEKTLLLSNTTTGRPLGSDSFISKLERKLKMRLRPRPIGRPKKKKKPKK